MKYTAIALIACITLGSCDGEMHFTHQCETAQLGYGPFIVDVPEEWQAISTDSTKPELMVVWKDSKGVVHINFDN